MRRAVCPKRKRSIRKTCTEDACARGRQRLGGRRLEGIAHTHPIALMSTISRGLALMRPSAHLCGSLSFFPILAPTIVLQVAGFEAAQFSRLWTRRPAGVRLSALGTSFDRSALGREYGCVHAR